MLKFLVLVPVLIAVTAGAGISSRLSPFGIVEGIKDCGSSGKLGTVQVTDCTVTPCHFVPNTIYDVAIRYTSSVTSETLHLRIVLYLPGGEEEILRSPINGVVEAGVEYELTFQLPVSDELSGRAFDIYIFITDYESNRIEVCAQAPVTIG